MVEYVGVGWGRGRRDADISTKRDSKPSSQKCKMSTRHYNKGDKKLNNTIIIKDKSVSFLWLLLKLINNCIIHPSIFFFFGGGRGDEKRLPSPSRAVVVVVKARSVPLDDPVKLRVICFIFLFIFFSKRFTVGNMMIVCTSLFVTDKTDLPPLRFSAIRLRRRA